jgi:hypothetical protein
MWALALNPGNPWMRKNHHLYPRELVNNIGPQKNCVTFMQIKQPTIIKYLRFKGYKNTVIRNEWVHFWHWSIHIHAVKYWATSFPAGGAFLEFAVTMLASSRWYWCQNFAYAWARPVSNICLLADSLDIAPSTVHHHLTNMLHFRSFYLRCVSHVLTSELYAKRVAKAKGLFDFFDV